jgi:hypothetical protein
VIDVIALFIYFIFQLFWTFDINIFVIDVMMQSNENGNSLYMTCKDNGKSGTFPLTNDIPPHPIEDFCFRLCGA